MVQFNDPWFHSWKRPINKIIRKKKEVIVQIFILEFINVKIIGKIKVISTSKIRKIIAIIKNRIEKGKRDEFNGLNPHSKGEDFSDSKNIFFLKIEEINIVNQLIKKIKIVKNINKKIIYIKKI